MQIVIDIDEKIYNEYMNLATGRIPTYKACDIAWVLKHGIAWVLKHGTVLPKGHGRLIDADLLGNQFPIWIDNFSSFVVNNTISKAPTIIEADKEN